MGDNLPATQEKKHYPSDPKERARMLVAEGKIGGPRPGSGRPRKKRAAELIAEKAQRNAEKIWSAFEDALEPSKPDSIRLAAAKELVALENRESELQLKEERAFEDTPKDELIAYLVDGFAQLQAGGFIPDIVDADVVEEISGGAS
jgi:hypothetical protein